jgi:ABC-type branched-subunit amino acid transport system ATPase component
MLIGAETPDSGEVEIGSTVKLAYVDQSRDCLDGEKTVFEEISGGADVLTVGKYETPARAYIGRFNFKGSDQQKRVGQLSGGERGRLHMAKTLIAGGSPAAERTESVASAVADQVGAPHLLQGFAQQRPVLGVVIAQESLVQAALAGAANGFDGSESRPTFFSGFLRL